MKSLIKLIGILIAFSVIFFSLRFYGSYIGYDVDNLIANLDGLAWLYSTIGTIFAVLAAFVIVSEINDWNTLIESSREEVKGLNEMLQWSKSLSSELSNEFKENIKKYLEIVIDKEWSEVRDTGNENAEARLLMDKFHPLITKTIVENPDIASYMFSTLEKIVDERAMRVEFSFDTVPKVTKYTAILVDIALVSLSFFIGVKSMWLDYTFQICIVALGSVILFVIDDLDNPLREGDWCLRPDLHKKLLRQIQYSNETPKK
ncbi:MAG: hypothetical protein WCF92_02365 [bacterium]